MSNRDNPSVRIVFAILRATVFWRSDIQRTVIGLAVEFGTVQRRPAPLRADPIAHRLIVQIEDIARAFVCLGHVTWRVDADRLTRTVELGEGTAVEIDVRLEARRIAPDDCQHHRQVVRGRANDRLRTAADSDPGFQRPGLDEREYGLVVEGRPCRTPAT